MPLVTTSQAFLPIRDVPWKDMVPLLGRSSPEMVRSRVVLPAPLGPTTNTDSPLPIWIDRPLRAVEPPKRTVRSLT